MNIQRTSGKGFLETVNGIRVLHLAGDPWERGFQHGSLLREEIEHTLPLGLTSASAVAAFMTGSPLEEGFEKLKTGGLTAGPFLPAHIRREMEGLAEALASAGSIISLDDIITWNTMYDTWCFYAHPDPSNPDGHPAEGFTAPGCSSFSAWGSATADGRLVFGKNMDNLDLPGIPEGRTVMIVRPDQGRSYVNMTLPGMLAIDGGMNDNGIAVMTHYSPSACETMRGCGIGTLSRLILNEASSLEDALNILGSTPRCTGINWHIADAKAGTAAVMETSAARTAVRYPESDILWTTNHSNCYPGWMGYDGVNMVEDQKRVFRLSDIRSIQAWQQSLSDRKNPYISGAGRFRRYRQLLDEHHGSIGMETGKRILSDRIDPDTGIERAWDAPSPGKNDGATISLLYGRIVYASGARVHGTGRTIDITGQTGNLWSMTALPESGDFAVAAQGFPAHRHGWVSFNLQKELNVTGS